MAKRKAEKAPAKPIDDQPRSYATTIHFVPEVWNRLQRYVMEQKLSGDRGCSAARVVNEAVEAYLERE